MSILLFVQISIITYGVVFAFIFIRDCLKHKEDFTKTHLFSLGLTGFFSDLLDTWGIGSFAPCQASFKFTGSCADENMPGTLNIAHTIPTIAEFLLFLQLIKIEGVTLVTLIAGAIIGSVFGASIVSKWSPKVIRIALGCALLALAGVLSCKLAHVGPFESTISPTAIVEELEKNGFTVTNGDDWVKNIKSPLNLPKEEKAIYSDPSITMSELEVLMPKLEGQGITTISDRELTQVISDHLVYGLHGFKLILGILINTLLGALMTIGVGLYAPCMAMISALGINVTAAFPVMMGSCAFLMPSAGLKFLKEGKYDRKAAAMISIFGLLGVFVAYSVASMLPMNVLTGIIICVMIYTAFTFFRDAKRKG